MVFLKTFQSGVLVLMVGLVLSCVEQGRQMDVRGEASSEQGLSISPPLVPSSTDMRDRWIGIKNDASAPCPLPGSGPWVVRDLFPAINGIVPPGLRSYCLYSAPPPIPGSGVPAGLAPLVLPNGGPAYLSQLGADRMVVGGAAAARSFETGMASLFDARFREQTGRLMTIPPPSAPTDRVRVALLDTSPTRGAGFGGSVVGRSGHGFNLAQLIKNHVCDGLGSCAADISTQLSMPLYVDSAGNVARDDITGGSFGSIGLLAESIAAEVSAWQASAVVPKLVVNMSLAWLPEYGGWDTDPIGIVVVQAVHSAIQDAYCRGALVLAAAGNQSNGPAHRTGLMLPALWETEAAPTLATCEALVGPASVGTIALPSDTYVPLLYAVGGIDHAGNALGVSREQGQPPHVAYGDHALTQVGAGWTRVMTGTSVSTSVVAAASALVWYYRPEASAHTVMQALYDGGVIVGTADSCLSAVSTCSKSSKRIDVCTALVSACGTSMDACPVPADMPTCSAWSTSLPVVSDLALSSYLSSPTNLARNIIGGPANDPACGAEDLYNMTSPALATDPCPHRQYWGVAAGPWVGPQPNSNPCPPCTISTKSGSAYLSSGDFDFSVFGDTPAITVHTPLRSKTYALGYLGAATEVVVALDPKLLSTATSVVFSAESKGASSSAALLLVDGP